MSIWETLSIEPTDDLKLIKRAYSTKLKIHRPDIDPEGYQALRAAFDEAKRQVKAGTVRIVEPSDSGPSDRLGQVDQETATETAASPITVEPNVELVARDVVEQELREHSAETPQPDSSGGDEVDELNAHSIMSERVLEMVQDIHEFVRDSKELEAVELFRQQLKSEELVSIDYLKVYELQVLEYLNWWCQKRLDDEDAWLPLGFMRQVIDHYEWHTSATNVLRSYPAFEQLYDMVHQSSGQNYLLRIRDKQVAANPLIQKASERLLGKYRPKMFSLISISSTRKNAIFALLDQVENMNDASFDFELNTETVKWWLTAKSRFLFQAWMLVVGLVCGAVLMGFVLDFLQSKQHISFTLNEPISTALAYLICVTISSYAIFKVVHAMYLCRVYLQDILSRYFGATLELVTGAAALTVVVVAEAVRLHAPYLFTITIFVAVIALAYLYRYRVFWLFGACVFMVGGYEMDLNVNADKPGSIELTLPILIVNTLFYWGYLDFKAKQRKRNYRVADMRPEMISGVSFLVILVTFAYSLIAL